MTVERPLMDGNEKPFAYMHGEVFLANIQEYLNVRNCSRDAIEANKQRLRLSRLKLSEDSIASEVRKKAEEMKVRFGWALTGKEHGDFSNTALDLFFVLQRTNDVYDFEDVLLYLFTTSNLEDVRHEHHRSHNHISQIRS